MKMLGYFILLTAVFVGAVLVYTVANIFRGPSLGERSESGDSRSKLGAYQSSTPEK